MKVLYFVAIMAVAQAAPANDQAVSKEPAKENDSKSNIQIPGNLMGNEDMKLQQFTSWAEKEVVPQQQPFLNQTGNEWNKKDDLNGKSVMSKRDASVSQLLKPVKDLVRLIFDVEGMKRTMIEFEIDMNKMPLEKLSKEQIMKAYKVLTEAQTALSNDAVDQIQIVDASNRFYTIIPHDFRMQKPPLLNNIELVKTKMDMLDNLLEIEYTYSMLKDSSSISGSNHIYLHYRKLKTQIDVLDNSSDEFSVIWKYVMNTHSKFHSYYKLEVMYIFKIARQGEEERYKPFKQMPNRQLLWHGSLTSNYGGILSKGLRIAPGTGGMFGRGIYFADMASKSANYCGVRTNSTGLLLLSEVALGEMYELTTAKSISKLPKGKQSTKGLGQTQPDPNDYFIRPDGVKVPYGMAVPSNFESSTLLHNEYVIYDPARINQQYLVQVNFTYL